MAATAIVAYDCAAKTKSRVRRQTMASSIAEFTCVVCGGWPTAQRDEMRKLINELPLKRLQQVCDKCQETFWLNCISASEKRRKQDDSMSSSCNQDTEQEATEPELSLEEMFARDIERLELTPEKVRSWMKARTTRVRHQLLVQYGLTEETLDSASENVKAELGSKLMYEFAHSTNAKIEHGLYKAAVVKEKRSLVKSKAEAILAFQRKRARTYSIPKKLGAAVRQRSTYLYHSELRGHFREKYIEEIEKSDLLIPVFKAAALNSEEPDMPNLHEVSSEMSAELLHPDAFGQIMTERHAAKQARREDRIERIRKFLFSDLPYVVRSLVRLCLQASPYLIVLVITKVIAHTYQTSLRHFDRITYQIASDGTFFLGCIIAVIGTALFYVRTYSSFEFNEPEPSVRSEHDAWSERREQAANKETAKYRRYAKVAFMLALILLVLSSYMHTE